MKKKILCAMMSVALVIGVMAGCGKNENTAASIESVNQENSTEVSRETKNTMPEWKQTFIDYFNNSSLDLSMCNYNIEDVNSDGVPEVILYGTQNGAYSDSKFVYLNKEGEAGEIDFPAEGIRAEGEFVYIVSGEGGKVFQFGLQA